ncbi:sugar phosphate nucleotidyltransferase [Candidatus Omnitrophota bacterium]
MKTKGIPVVILCGGKGTRLREHTEYFPKPLVEVGGRPILWHVMKTFSHYGYKDFILCLGYKSEAIKQFFVNYSDWRDVDFKLQRGDIVNNKRLHDDVKDWNITFVDTGLETNTGGRVKKARPYIDGDVFFATYADAVSDIDLNLLLDFHKKKGKIATVTCINPISQFGIVASDKKGFISEFKEKPRLNQWINGGFFVFKKGIFKYLQERDVLERDTFNRLVAQQEAVAYKFKGFWACMDTYKDTMMLDGLFKKGESPWIKWDHTWKKK